MIRLTLVLLTALITAMLVWGTETPDMRAEAIKRVVLDAPAPRSVDEIVPVVVEAQTPVIEPNAESNVEMARLEPLVMTGIPATDTLLVFQANDAPRDAVLSAVIPDDAAVLIVTGTSVNMRAGPSTNQAIIGRMRQGERAELLTKARDGWVQVRAVPSGQIGFMAGRFLKPAQ